VNKLSPEYVFEDAITLELDPAETFRLGPQLNGRLFVNILEETQLVPTAPAVEVPLEIAVPEHATVLNGPRVNPIPGKIELAMIGWATPNQ
jgi:hypothetical protein